MTKKSYKKTVLILLTIMIVQVLCGCSKKQPSTHPNIVFILADDTGTDVFDAYGGISYNTKNIDELAKTGLTFNQCYSAPVCSPSRVKLLTGRYGFRTGQTWGTIPEDEITIAHQLKKAGYKTAISGKWQLALLKDEPNHIQKMGFDESCVFGWHEGPRYYQPVIYQNGKLIKSISESYGPEIYSDFLIDFMKRNKDTPFFAYYSMTLAHTISNDLKTPPPTGQLGRYETFKENVELADLYVGKIIKALNDLELSENTIVFFVGDNGTPHHYISTFQDGEYIQVPVFSKVKDTLLQGGKSYLTDQGTHVPLFVNWKGKTPSGKSIDDLIDFSDFMNTIIELTGSELPNDRIIDGHSFAPQIIDKKGTPRSWIYQEWEGKGWIRNQDWKLYFNDTLYHMKTDPFEKKAITEENITEKSKEIKDYLREELIKLKSKE